MQTVIHLSDFHIEANMPEPTKHPVFSSLVEQLKSMSLENPILLYGGDVIDTESIRAGINPALNEHEKAELWDQGAAKCFRKAKSYFDYLIHALKIPDERIIICCGNHDINPFRANMSQISCPAGCNCAEYDPARFEQFSEFCASLQSKKKDTSETYFREIGNLNFLVLNTNWINKWVEGKRQNLCINCSQIDAIIKEKKAKIEQVKKQGRLSHNIVVAHAPSGDYCEYATAGYSENNYQYIEAYINSLFGLKLYGDKHTEKSYHVDYIIGTRLNEKQLSFSIHQFGEQSHRYIPLLYCKGAWSASVPESEIDDILSISKPSISNQALFYLFDSKDDADLANKILRFDRVRNTTRWNELNKLFKYCTDIQKPRSKGAGIRIPYKKGETFIDKLSTLTADFDNNKSITVRGDTRMGKSMCMSVLYMNLLHGFICGQHSCLPVYINLEQVIAGIENQTRSSTSFLNEIRKKVTLILDEGIRLARQREVPACCIIDGLNESILYRNANIEKMLADILSEKNRRYRTIVYCIDKNYNKTLGSTPQHNQQKSDYVVYFNRILSDQINSNRRYSQVLKAFGALKQANGKTVDTVMATIERMRIPGVDIGFLGDFWGDLSSDNCVSFLELIEEYTEKHIPSETIMNAAKAYYAYRSGVPYDELMARYHISNDIFDLFRTHHLIAQYLLAKCYVDQIRNTPDEIAHGSCLNQIYNHEECLLIREYIQVNNMDSQVIQFAQRRYEELTLEGKSTITYILGRLSVAQERRNDVLSILEQQEKLLLQSSGENRAPVHHSIAKRSVLLSQICVAENPSELLHQYLDILLSDSDERLVNRTFYLQYYSDRPNTNDDSIFEGFDFYNTYNTLARRLKKWHDKDEPYTLLELELFTLCDLLQIRLDNPQAISRRKNSTVPSFFYSTKYTEKTKNKAATSQTIAVLSFMLEIIDAYLERHNSGVQRAFFQNYLHIQREHFQIAVEKLEHGPLSEKQDRYIPRMLLEKLSGLSQVKRIGWSIAKPIDTTISDTEFAELKSKGVVYENTLQHTYEAFLIGLLYLPNKSSHDLKYNKQKILNLLLVHDLGETEVGDLIPQYENYQDARNQERKFCEKLFLEGMHQHIGDMAEYYELWEIWCSGGIDYNVRVAKDIDKIQMLYKLFKLIDKNEPRLTKERVQDFWKSRLEIETDEGRAIFNLLVLNDPNASRFGSEYGLSTIKLS